MATVEITKENFESTILNNDVVVFDFWAEWCGPCRSFAPTFEKASERHQDVVFGKIDTQVQRELAGALGISSIPTVMVFREKVLLYSEGGALPPAGLEELLGWAKGLDMVEVKAEIERRKGEPGNAEA